LSKRKKAQRIRCSLSITLSFKNKMLFSGICPQFLRF